MKLQLDALVIQCKFATFLKNSLLFFLYLNIYSCFFFGINAQELTLSLKTEKPISQSLKDSLQIQTTFTDYTSLKKETDTVYLKLQRLGFIESELHALIKENDSSYTATYFLGKKYNQIKVFYSEEDFSRKELQRVSSEVKDNYFTLPFTSIPISLKKLTALRTQKGNAFARIKLTELEKDSNNILTASLKVDNRNTRTVDSIIVKGYEKFPQSFLKYYAGVRTERIFNKEKLVQQNENLNSLGFVSAIKPPEALFRKDSTTVYFYLEKQNNNLFDGILGFGTDEETQKLKFNGYLNLELNNNLNYGEQLTLNYKADGEEQVNFRVKANLPYLFQTPFGVSGELKIFKRDSSFVTSEQELRASYQINPRSTTYLGYRSNNSSNLLDEVIAGTPIVDFKSKFLIAGASWAKQQNRKNFPIKTFLSFNGGIGSREKEGSKDNQVRLEAVVNNIFNLNYKNSVFVQNISSILISDSYLVNELYRFGGINSIRGFNENSIDASLYSIVNTEYRYQFNEGVYIHSIIDVAYFENETLSLKENLYSFGIGLGLATKAGLFKFNIANGNTESQNFNFSNTKIHISLSSKF